MAGVVDYFLKIDSIDGESQDSKHANEIELQSWHFGATQTGTHSQGVGGGGAGKVSMSDFHFVARYNKAVPKLTLACATGQHIASAKLTCRKAGGKQEEFYTVTFTDVLVSSVNTTGSGTDDQPIPLVSIALNFTKIEEDYKPQNKDGTLGGSVKSGYDLKKNTKV